MMRESHPGFTPLTDRDLPLYRRGGGDYELFYAPRYLVVAPASEAKTFTRVLLHTPERHPAARQLHRHALSAREIRATQIKGDFNPVCLTLYLHNECNLRCSYCFTAPTPGPGPMESLMSIVMN